MIELEDPAKGDVRSHLYYRDINHYIGKFTGKLYNLRVVHCPTEWAIGEQGHYRPECVERLMTIDKVSLNEITFEEFNQSGYKDKQEFIDKNKDRCRLLDPEYCWRMIFKVVGLTRITRAKQL